MPTIITAYLIAGELSSGRTLQFATQVKLQEFVCACVCVCVCIKPAAAKFDTEASSAETREARPSKCEPLRIHFFPACAIMRKFLSSRKSNINEKRINLVLELTLSHLSSFPAWPRLTSQRLIAPHLTSCRRRSPLLFFCRKHRSLSTGSGKSRRRLSGLIRKIPLMQETFRQRYFLST